MWGSFSSILDARALVDLDRNEAVVLAFGGLTMTQLRGEVNGSSTSGTGVVVNPLIHEADALKLRYATEVGSARYIPVVFDTEDKIRQYLYNSFRTIEELHQILASDYNPEGR
ncbi:unnamed protein product [Linum tenue]|uniref:Uncharacterized protein n=1 Tax=Linum tenue TaxID=586396 RepID=A0AAV0ID85_9ROSI|nr:unnamed protein product [Linum tenue]